MSIATALRAVLGIALLTAMDAVIKAQMQQHPFLLALFMRFAMGGLCALAVLVSRARPSRRAPA
jgi:drug/metabolite transporter (DMT)-like permease